MGNKNSSQSCQLSSFLLILVVFWSLLGMRGILKGDTLISSDLAEDVNKVIKNELEKEFGPLNDQIVANQNEIYGRVIGIDYALPAGKRLDESWGNKVVAALGRLDITAEYSGSEVRAENQEIAGNEASSIQFTTSRSLDDPDVIGFVAMFLENK